MTEEEQTAAQVVRTLATANNVRIADLAKVLGVSKTALYARLAGETAFLFREIVALAKYFQVDLNRFLVSPRTRPLPERVHLLLGALLARLIPIPRPGIGSQFAQAR